MTSDTFIDKTLASTETTKNPGSSICLLKLEIESTTFHSQISPFTFGVIKRRRIITSSVLCKTVMQPTRERGPLALPFLISRAWPRDHSHRDEKHHKLPLDLLQVSRRIYSEAALIPYVSTDWRLDAEAFQPFIRSLAPFQIHNIKTLTIFSWGDVHDNGIHQKNICKLKGLEEFNARVFGLSKSSQGLHLLGNFEQRPLLRASLIHYRRMNGSIKNQEDDAFHAAILKPYRQIKAEREADLKAGRDARWAI